MAIKRRSFPMFILTGKTEVIVERPSEAVFVKGRKVEGVPTRHTIECNVQPAKPRELWLLPEADRNREWIKILCDPCEDIRGALEGVNGHDADMVIWKDNYYKVMKISRWEMGVLDHTDILAARVPHSAGYDRRGDGNS